MACHVQGVTSILAWEGASNSAARRTAYMAGGEKALGQPQAAAYTGTKAQAQLPLRAF